MQQLEVFTSFGDEEAGTEWRITVQGRFAELAAARKAKTKQLTDLAIEHPAPIGNDHDLHDRAAAHHSKRHPAAPRTPATRPV